MDDPATIRRRGRDLALELVAAAIERVTPALGLLIPPLLALIGAGVIAGTVIGHAVWESLRPLDLDDTLMFGLLMATLLLPAVLLVLFWMALSAVRELPEKLRHLPESFVRHRSTLGEITRATRERRGLPRNLWRTLKLLYTGREDLVLYAPLLELLNPALLLGTALAVPAVLFELALAATILISRTS